MLHTLLLNLNILLTYLAYTYGLVVLELMKLPQLLKGLKIVGVTATHRNIKTGVFHMIDLLKKGDVAIGATLL